MMDSEQIRDEGRCIHTEKLTHQCDCDYCKAFNAGFVYAYEKIMSRLDPEFEKAVK